MFEKIEVDLLYLLIVLQSLVLIRQWYLLQRCGKNCLDKPVNFNTQLVRKDNNMALVYRVSVGPTSDADVVKRRLTVEVNGEVVENASYPKETVDLGEFSFAQDDEVVLSLVDVDDSDNASEPSVLAFVALDTIPPQAPGGFSVALVREVPDPVDPVDPVDEVPSDPKVTPPSED